MSSYNIEFLEEEGILKVGFGSSAPNDQIVREVTARLKKMIVAGELPGGEIIKVNGPASLPVAMVLAHKLAHLYQAIACFDPKLLKYVVVITHGWDYIVGDLID